MSLPPVNGAASGRGERPGAARLAWWFTLGNERKDNMQREVVSEERAMPVFEGAVRYWAGVYVKELFAVERLAVRAARERLRDLLWEVRERVRSGGDQTALPDEQLVDWYRGGGPVSRWAMNRTSVRVKWVKVARVVVDLALAMEPEPRRAVVT